MSNVFGLVGAMDAIERILAARVKIQGARAHWIVSRRLRHVVRKRAKPPLLIGSRRPSRPFCLAGDRGHAGPGLTSLAHGRAIADRLASWQHVVDEGSSGIDQDRARRFLPVVLNDLTLIVGEIDTLR